MDLKVEKFSNQRKFEKKLYENVEKVEAAVPRIYTDSKGIPTVGIGYALLIKKGRYYEEREGWVTDMKTAVGKDTPKAGKIKKQEALALRKLIEIRDILNGWGADAERREKAWKKQWDLKYGESPGAAKKWEEKLEKKRVNKAQKIIKPWLPGEDSKAQDLIGFPLLTRKQMKTLFYKVIPEYKAIFDRRIKKEVKKFNEKVNASNQTIDNNLVEEVLEELKHSRESLALMSLVFNAPGLIGPGLTAALINRDRAEAWYQIRHYSNGGANSNEKNGIAKRRYFEASTFGLYNDPGDVTLEEGTAVLKMYEDHKNKIDAYEKKFEKEVENANRDYALKPPDVVLTLEESLKPANDAVNPTTITRRPRVNLPPGAGTPVSMVG